MTDMKKLTPHSNQARRANRVLNAIRKSPQNFDMGSWHNGQPLGPEDKVTCGTTLCVAGWAAHFAGYYLEDGTATKVGEMEKSVSEVAGEWLDIGWEPGEPSTDLFYSTSDVAVAVLKRMASGERYTRTMVEEEQERSWAADDLGNRDRMLQLLDIDPSGLRD